jgi:hypothetical protein
LEVSVFRKYYGNKQNTEKDSLEKGGNPKTASLEQSNRIGRLFSLGRSEKNSLHFWANFFHY